MYDVFRYELLRTVPPCLSAAGSAPEDQERQCRGDYHGHRAQERHRCRFGHRESHIVEQIAESYAHAGYQPRPQRHCFYRFYYPFMEQQKAEMEYKEHPELYEDLTEYDEEGRPYVKTRNIIYVMPDRNYENFLDEMTLDDGKYSDLTIFDNIYVLLDCRKFVKPITSGPNVFENG